MQGDFKELHVTVNLPDPVPPTFHSHCQYKDPINVYIPALLFLVGFSQGKRSVLRSSYNFLLLAKKKLKAWFGCEETQIS
jgi:hypothetical protein